MDNYFLEHLKSAPKFLVAICAAVLLLDIIVLLLNFKAVAFLRFLITLFLLYKVLTGSKAASIILALCLIVGSFFALYPIYFAFQVFGGAGLTAAPMSFYLKLVTFSIPSALMLVSAYYIFSSAGVKLHSSK